jgi:hypothetical protein
LFSDIKVLCIEKLELNGYEGTEKDPVLLEHQRDLTLTIVVKANDTIINGTMNMIVLFKKLGPIFKRTFSLCEDLLPQSNEQCPITPKTHTYKAITTIGNEVPRGEYLVQVSLVTTPPSVPLLHRDIYLVIR